MYILDQSLWISVARRATRRSVDTVDTLSRKCCLAAGQPGLECLIHSAVDDNPPRVAVAEVERAETSPT